MENWVAVCQLGRLLSEERLCEAENHRRLIHSKQFGQLPLLLRGLLVLFS
jgi:hypothetical protein